VLANAVAACRVPDLHVHVIGMLFSTSLGDAPVRSLISSRVAWRQSKPAHSYSGWTRERVLEIDALRKGAAHAAAWSPA
jgi:hypothetical protein